MREFSLTNHLLLCSIGGCNIGAGTIAVIGAPVNNNTESSQWRPHVGVRTSGGVERLSLFPVDVYLGPESGYETYVSIGTPGGNRYDDRFGTATGPGFIAGTKASGTAVPKIHRYNYGVQGVTEGGVWHRTSGTAFADAALPGSDGRVYMRGPGTGATYGMAVMGIWDRALSDDEIELLPFSLIAWLALAPSGFWLFDQSATTQSVVDLTGNGANQVSLAGTGTNTRSIPVLTYGAESTEMVYEAGGVAGENYQRAVTEALGGVDSLVAAQGRLRELTEALGWADAPAAIQSLVRTPLEDTGLADALSVRSTTSRSLVDSLSTSDQVLADSGKKATVVEPLGQVDTVESLQTLVHELVSEALLDDVMVNLSFLGLQRIITDGLQLTDARGITWPLGIFVRGPTRIKNLRAGPTRGVRQ